METPNTPPSIFACSGWFWYKIWEPRRYHPYPIFTNNSLKYLSNGKERYTLELVQIGTTTNVKYWYPCWTMLPKHCKNSNTPHNTRTNMLPINRGAQIMVPQKTENSVRKFSINTRGTKAKYLTNSGYWFQTILYKTVLWNYIETWGKLRGNGWWLKRFWVRGGCQYNHKKWCIMR